MYASFAYTRPKSLGELYELLGQGGWIYAGGTDLLVLLRSGKISTDRLIDVKEIPELQGIREENGKIIIGAACCFTEISENTLVREKLPGLAAGCRAVGSPQIRNKGTLGGNIQNSSPAGDGLNAAYALGAAVKLLSAAGGRLVPLTEFIQGPRKTLLQPGEVLVEVQLPTQEWTYQKFFKVGRRNALAISVVNGLVALTCNGDSTIRRARISLGAVAPTPIQLTVAEEYLAGRFLDAETLFGVEELIRASVKPISDIRASKEYRSYIAGVSVRRALVEALGEEA